MRNEFSRFFFADPLRLYGKLNLSLPLSKIFSLCKRFLSTLHKRYFMKVSSLARRWIVLFLVGLSAKGLAAPCRTIPTVQSFEAISKNTMVELHWTPPAKQRCYKGFLIRRDVGTPPMSPTDGDFVYRGKSIHMIDVDMDRGLANETLYFYSIFTEDVEGNFSDPFIVSALPQDFPESPNLAANGDFSDGLLGWSGSAGASYTVVNCSLPDYEYCVRITPTDTAPGYLSQEISDLEEKSLYTISVATFTTTGALPPAFSVNGPIQQQQEYFCCPESQGFGPKTRVNGSAVGYWREQRFVIWTGSSDDPEKPFEGAITLTLAATTSQDPGEYVQFTNVRVQQGVAPMLGTPLSPNHPFDLPDILPFEATSGDNLVMNSSLDGNADQIPNWRFISAEMTSMGGENVIQLNPSSSVISVVTQSNPYFLVPSSEGHLLTCQAKVSEAGKVGGVVILSEDGSVSHVELVRSTDWESIEIPINDPFWFQPIIYLEADNSQGDGWHMYCKDFQITANGNEWLPTPNPNPPLQAKAREWTFENGLDHNEWLVSSLLGSQVHNLEITESGTLKINTYGNLAPNAREGGMIASRDFFASGRYDAWVKMGPVYDEQGNILDGEEPIGCAFAIFPFHFINYSDSQPQWYDEIDNVRNTEVDWEFPADVPKGNVDPNPPHCPIINFSGVRCNSWGGQRGGVVGNIEMHETLPQGVNAADGTFHQYTLVWSSGIENPDGTRTPGYIEWYLDTGDRLRKRRRVARFEGNSYGFDNVPNKACRLELGAWFPSGGYGPDSCRVDSFAGNADFYRAEFEIEKVSYTPRIPRVRPNRDTYVAETDPNDDFWPPDLYPNP